MRSFLVNDRFVIFTNITRSLMRKPFSTTNITRQSIISKENYLEEQKVSHHHQPHLEETWQIESRGETVAMFFDIRGCSMMWEYLMKYYLKVP